MQLTNAFHLINLEKKYSECQCHFLSELGSIHSPTAVLQGLAQISQSRHSASDCRHSYDNYLSKRSMTTKCFIGCHVGAEGK